MSDLELMIYMAGPALVILGAVAVFIFVHATWRMGQPYEPPTYTPLLPPSYDLLGSGASPSDALVVSGDVLRGDRSLRDDDRPLAVNDVDLAHPGASRARHRGDRLI